MVALFEDVEGVVAVLTEFHELRVAIADLLHDFVDFMVGSLVLALPIGSFLIGRPFNHEDVLVGDAAVVIGYSGDFGVYDCVPEAGSSGTSVDRCFLDSIDDDIHAVAAVGEHDLETMQHLHLFIGHHETAVPVLQRHHDQEAHLFQIGCHGADVVEVNELAEAGGISVARHIYNCPLVVSLPAGIEIGLFCD
jgi:hypothetical protein